MIDVPPNLLLLSLGFSEVPLVRLPLLARPLDICRATRGFRFHPFEVLADAPNSAPAAAKCRSISAMYAPRRSYCASTSSANARSRLYSASTLPNCRPTCALILLPPHKVGIDLSKALLEFLDIGAALPVLGLKVVDVLP